MVDGKDVGTRLLMVDYWQSWLVIFCMLFSINEELKKHNYRYSQHVTNNQLLSRVVPIVLVLTQAHVHITEVF